MQGLMMDDYQLTLPPILRRAETFFGDKEVVTRLPDKSFHRYTYRDMAGRAKQLAVALQKLGLERGDRVATLCWNHYQHLEAYFGIPCGGYVLHTLNLRLHPSDLTYVADHAADRAVIVDKSLLPLLEQFKDETKIEHVIVIEDYYEDLLSIGLPTNGAIPSSTSAPPRPCASRAGRPAAARASSTRTARRSCTRSAWRQHRRSAAARLAQRHAAPGRADVPRQRLGLPRIWRRCSARSSSSRGRFSTRRASSRTSSRRR